MSKGFLVGLGAVAAAALLALAFVLGRESGSSSAPPPATKIERVAPRKVDEPPPSSDPTATRVPEITERLLVPAQAPLPAQLGVSPGQPSAPVESRSNAGSDPERASVAAYFDAIERIQSGAVGGDPNGVATEMASALASGDTSSLDKMIQDTESAKARLAAVVPPAPCAAHHRESLASLDDALDVLRALKMTMSSSEPAAQLGTVSDKAQTLRTRADALQKEEQRLRERYGLKR